MAASEVPGPPPRVRAFVLVLAPVVFAVAAWLGRAPPPPAAPAPAPAVPSPTSGPEAAPPGTNAGGAPDAGGVDPASGSLFWLLPQSVPPPSDMDDD